MRYATRAIVHANKAHRERLKNEKEKTIPNT